MILDTLKNSAKYENLHPRFKTAFDFIENTDFLKLELGITEIDGKNLFVNYIEIMGKTPETAHMETHNEYIDIQIPLTAAETMGFIPASELKSPDGEYDAEKDTSFFNDKATTFVKVCPGQFAIFFPEDGHQPGIGEATFRKIIVKVRNLKN